MRINYIDRVNVSTAAAVFQRRTASNNTQLGLDLFGVCVSLPGFSNHRRLGERPVWSAAGADGLRGDLVARRRCSWAWPTAWLPMLFGRVLLGIGVSALPTATRAMSAWTPAGQARIRAGNHAFGGAAGQCAHAAAGGLIDCAGGWRGSFVVLGIAEPGVGGRVGLVFSRRSRRSSADHCPAELRQLPPAAFASRTRKTRARSLFCGWPGACFR